MTTMHPFHSAPRQSLADSYLAGDERYLAARATAARRGPVESIPEPPIWPVIGQILCEMSVCGWVMMISALGLAVGFACAMWVML